MRFEIEPLERRELLTVPVGFTEQTIVAGIPHVAGMTVASDGTIYLSQQKTGQVRVVKNGVLQASAFATLPVSTTFETGLTGITVDSNFASNRYLYAYWTAKEPTIHNVVTRFTVNSAGTAPVAGSRLDLLHLPGTSQFHQGGAMGIGPDGKLYVTVGDHGQPNKAQALDSVFGKVLRLNRDGSIPADNSFYDRTTGIHRAIWATGLRNPFQMDFQPGTGRLFINDVGQQSFEEVNQGFAGANYGWPLIEGLRTTQTPPANYRDPVYTYPWGSDGGKSITGSAFQIGGGTYPFPAEYQGRYFFSDYVGGWIKTIDPADPHGTVQSFGTGFDAPLAIERAPDGSLLVLNHGAESPYEAAVVRIRYVGNVNQPPFISSQPRSTTVPAGQPATFNVDAGGPGTLSYQWQKNGVNLNGATGSTLTFTATAADNNANYRVIVSNAFGSTTSTAAKLTVVSNQFPNPVINTPATTLKWKGGQTISFSGSATDPEDGALGAAKMSWSVAFHHDTHSHPFIDEIKGVSSGTFTLPTNNETAHNVWYRVALTVTDSGGLSRTVLRDIYPVKANVTLAVQVGGVNTSGFKLSLDGGPVTTSYSFLGVAGIQRQIGAAASQVVNGVTYDLLGWADGGNPTKTISTPDVNKTYVARYQKRTGTPTVSRVAVADAYVADGSSAGLNFGGRDPLVVRSSGAGLTRITYLKFDIANLATVTTAKLRLFMKLGGSAAAVPVAVYAVGSTGWTETGITYNNRPARGALLASKSVGGTSFAAVEYDLSSYVKQQRTAGAKFISLALVAQIASGVPVQITSREAGTNRPTLLVS